MSNKKYSINLNDSRFESIKEKYIFIKNLDNFVKKSYTNITGVEYVGFRYLKSPLGQEQFDEYLVVHYKGGAFSARGINCSSNAAILSEFAELQNGGYYKENEDFLEKQSGKHPHYGPISIIKNSDTEIIDDGYIQWLDKDTIVRVYDTELVDAQTGLRYWINAELWLDDHNSIHICVQFDNDDGSREKLIYSSESPNPDVCNVDKADEKLAEFKFDLTVDRIINDLYAIKLQGGK